MATKSLANIIVMTVGGNEKYYSWTASDSRMVEQSRLPSEAARKSMASFEFFFQVTSVITTMLKLFRPVHLNF
jgi:hypothetical protein